MGTSADFGGPKGGAWTTYKHAAARYARLGGESQRNGLLNSYARAVAGGGGGGGGAGGARVGGGAVSHAQVIAAFGATFAEGGLDAALTEFGLGDLVGGERFEVLGALLDKLTGDGSALDDVPAKSALNDAMSGVFPADAQTYDELAAVTIDGPKFARLLEQFVSGYVFHQVKLVLAKYLQKCATVAEQQQRERDLRGHIRSLVAIETQGRDFKQIDWRGTEGQLVFDTVIDNLQSILEAGE